MNLPPDYDPRHRQGVRPFPKVVDSTMMADFIQCAHKFYEAHILNIRSMAMNVHLHFGGCFAKGLQVMRENFYDPAHRNYNDANASTHEGWLAIIKEWGDYEINFDTPKTLEACLVALQSFVAEYPLERDVVTPLLFGGKPAVEFTFALPIPGSSHPDTGEPVIYAGRFDMLAQYQGQGVFINDEKTTTSLGQSWPLQWKLRSQLTGYVWGAESYGHNITGAVIRGVGILKRDITHAFVIQHRPRFMVERWLYQLGRNLDMMVESWNNDYWDYAFDTACSQFGGCPYMRICGGRDQTEERKNYVEVEPWNPLEKSGLSDAA